jgi:hypothetical protein
VTGTRRHVESAARGIRRLDIHCLRHDISNPFLFLGYGGSGSFGLPTTCRLPNPP